MPATIANPASRLNRFEPRHPAAKRTTAFLGGFGAAWLALDRLASSPPAPLRALAALGSGAAIITAAETAMEPGTLRSTLAHLGLGRPSGRAMGAALAVGSAVASTFAAGALISRVHVSVRPNWPSALVGALLFHGIAEELVWRGYVFGHFRRRHSRRRAIALSMPLIALTHVPILLKNGYLVGTLAITSAAMTCLSLSYLYERGNRTIWPAAIVHGLIGTWQLLEPTYPAQYKVVILLASIVVPLAAFAFGDAFFASDAPRPALPLGAGR